MGDFLAPRYLGWLFDGFLVTLGLSIAVVIAALLIGFGLCAARLASSRAVRWAATAWLSAFRNTPLLVQLLFWYFGVAALIPDAWMQWLNQPHHFGLVVFDIHWPSFELIAGFWGLTLYSAAFIAEELRAGVRGVKPGQLNAARALGLSETTLWLHVILPQATRNAFSPLLGQAMNIVKNSSLTMAIGVAELSYASRQVETQTFRTFEAFGIATLLYVLLIAAIEAAGYVAWRSDRVVRATRA